MRDKKGKKRKIVQLNILYRRSKILRFSIVSIAFSILTSSLIIPILLIMNLFIIDLTAIPTDGGTNTAHSLTNLSVEDVTEMTDLNNILTIITDGGDSVALGETADGDWVESPIGTFTATNGANDTVTVIIEGDGIVTTPVHDGSGVIVDGIIEGLYYETSSGMSGYTDEDGSFDYLEGDVVTFKLGSVLIGDIDMGEIGDGKVFLQDLADVERTDMNDEYVENMAVLLQSIDSDDGDKIVITEEMRETFADESFDLATMSEEELIAIIEDKGEVAVSEADAMAHVGEMLGEYAEIDESELDEHLTDMTAHLHTKEEGITYTTILGLSGELESNGKFNYYEDDDVITFVDASGDEILVINSKDIAENGQLNLAELLENYSIDEEIETEEILIAETDSSDEGTDEITDDGKIITESETETEEILIAEIDSSDEGTDEITDDEKIITESEIETEVLGDDSMLFEDSGINFDNMDAFVDSVNENVEQNSVESPLDFELSDILEFSTDSENQIFEDDVATGDSVANGNETDETTQTAESAENFSSSAVDPTVEVKVEDIVNDSII